MGYHLSVANVEDYLRLRRALGYKLERHGMLLPKLVAHLEAAGVTTLTSSLAIEWARLPERARPSHWAARLAVARGFARYLTAIDPATEVPPPGVFPARRHRPHPLPVVAGGDLSPARQGIYWYLSASPELMALAAERLDACLGTSR